MGKVQVLALSHSTIGTLKPAISRSIRLAAWGLAIAALVVPIDPRIVERAYSRRLFPFLQAGITTFSNLTPFAMLDALIIVVAIWWLWLAARDIVVQRKRRWRALAPIAQRTATVAAVGYLVFLVVWGLNYRRVPVREKVAFDASRVTSASARPLLQHTVERLNALYAAAHAELDSTPVTVSRERRRAFDRALHNLGQTSVAVPARPKHTLLDPYFRRAGVAGMTDPFFLETFMASDLLAVERPFILAHEWGHLAGFADESEANLVGWLTCVRGSVADEYSGWLFLYGELVPAVPQRDARPIMARLDAGPRDDLNAIRERLQRNLNPRMSAAGWAVYDKYLKANRIEEGAASYAEVVTLILGTEWEDGWVPALRSDN